MKNKIAILNITHGDNTFIKRYPFIPIAAGACRDDIVNDACGEDNISSKNRYYGDFTSIYWAWKNLKNIDIIGTSHYRRYLADEDDLGEPQYNFSFKQFSHGCYSYKRLISYLDNYDIVMLNPAFYGCTVKEQYISCHYHIENLDIVTDSLKKIHPDSVKIWEEYLSSYKFQPGYLFLTKWDIFDEMCSWLYPVLLDVETKINLSLYSGYQERVIAFLYERLAPVFIYSKHYKIKFQPLYYITKEDGPCSLFMFKIREKLRRIKKYIRNE